MGTACAAPAPTNMNTLLILFGLTTFIVTSIVSLGKHSHIHDAIALVAMFLEGALVVLALTGHVARWPVASLIMICFILVFVSDTDKGNIAMVQWWKEIVHDISDHRTIDIG